MSDLSNKFYAKMRAICIILFSLLIVCGCKKSKSIDPNKITSDKWTKVSDEVIEGYKDIQIVADHSIFLLSDDYIKMNSNFQIIFKYKEISAPYSSSLRNSEFTNTPGYFDVVDYNNGYYEYLITFNFIRDGMISNKMSVNSNDLYGDSIKAKNILNFIQTDNNPYFAYSNVYSTFSDSLYFFGHYFGAGYRLQADKLFSIRSPDFKATYLISLNKNFILSDYRGEQFYLIDENRELFYQRIPFKKMIKLSEKLLIITEDGRILSTLDGLNYITVIEKLNFLYLNSYKSPNDSTLVALGSNALHLININSKTQESYNANGLPDGILGSSSISCFPYFDKLVLFTNKGIYARLIQ